MMYQTIEFRIEVFYVMLTLLFIWGLSGYIYDLFKWILLMTSGYKGDYKYYTKENRRIKCNRVWNIGIWELYKWIKEGDGP